MMIIIIMINIDLFTLIILEVVVKIDCQNPYAPGRSIKSKGNF